MTTIASLNHLQKHVRQHTLLPHLGGAKQQSFGHTSSLQLNVPMEFAKTFSKQYVSRLFSFWSFHI
jgi:hypothetical protein